METIRDILWITGIVALGVGVALLTFYWIGLVLGWNNNKEKKDSS